MSNIRQKNVNKGIVFSIFTAILIPTILTNLVTSISSFADAIIVGNFLGEDALSAVTYNSPVFMLINTIAAILAVGGATAIGVLVGKGDKQKANVVFSTAITFGVLISSVLAVLGVVFIDNVVLMLGTTAESVDFVKSYSIVIVSAIPVFVLNISFAFFVRNDGAPKKAMAGMLSAIVTNIVFDIIFIGFCNTGIAGGAYAMVLAQFVSLAIISTHFFSKKNTLRFKISFKVKTLLLIIKNGISTSMTFVYQLITMLTLNHIISTIAGNDGMVVYTVVFNVNLIAMSIFEGLSQTIQPIVSVYHGEKNQNAIKKTMKYALIAGGILCITVILLVELFPHGFTHLFGVPEESYMFSSSITAIRIVAPAMIFMTINVLLSYYYQSREIRSISFVIVICRNLILFLSGIIILTSIFGINGVWLTYGFAEILTLIIVVISSKLMCIKNKNLNGLLLMQKNKNSIYFEFDLNKYNENFENKIKEYLLKNNKSIDLEQQINNNLHVINKEILSELENKNNDITGSIYMSIDDTTGNVELQYWYSGKLFKPVVVENISKSNVNSSYLTVLAKNRLTLLYEVV